MSIEAKIKLSGANAVSINGEAVRIEGGVFVADDVPKLIAALHTLMRWRDEAEGKTETASIDPPPRTTPLTREELDAMRAEAPPADMSVMELSEVQLSKLRSVIDTTTKDGERNVYLTPGDPRRWIDAFEAMTGRLRYMNNGAFKLGTYGELWIEEAGTDLSHVETPFKRQYDPEVMERG